MSNRSEPERERRRRVPGLLWGMLGVIVVGLIVLWLAFSSSPKPMATTTTIPPNAQPAPIPEPSRPVQR
ncbi:hypothetical protein [Caulobacter sp. NIBR2454]|uniref:hypothetical protein n=1 Tax=Caulobacter sp. NIBR2454 TaxID=3015996 RepID=UPI0022B71CAB|nr:hypothetical protein [Caulobacter sp. NIBR2454]